MTHKEYKSKSQMKRVEILKAEKKQMTHEELLAKIDEMNRILVFSNAPFEGMDKLYKALLSLRAVVELHKPKVKPGTPNDLLCEECARQCTGNGHIFYPCPTIQAIEKELNG